MEQTQRSGSAGGRPFEQVIHHAAVGEAEIEQQIPITFDSVFHAASVLKQFTAFAILLFEQDGKPSIDNPLAQHIQGCASCGDYFAPFLTHTSGLRLIRILTAWQVANGKSALHRRRL
ncbi:serine hydrolase [Granulicella cerasi]|uniref:Serine hydrolase n=2 Tax=Granulicella cerasi TaxID=741063 RepID=A0ABW1ZCE7_9BACT